MLKIIWTRLQQGFRTVGYPRSLPSLPDRFRGLPRLEPARCQGECGRCEAVCPTGAIAAKPGEVRLDLGQCIFCGECEAACPRGAIQFTREHGLAARRRAELSAAGAARPSLRALDQEQRRLFGRSLRLRQVSAGGCNACEADVNVLSTVVFDLSRFGIQFVASPRHADGLLVTGPVTENMRLALLKTYAAVPAPKLVIAAGACAISGGIYRDHPEAHNGVESVLPVDLFIPGCPPHPYTTLEGLLGLLGRLPKIKTPIAD